MALLLTSLLLGGVACVAYQVSLVLLRHEASRRHGCKSPPQKPTWDPILGIPYKLENFKGFESGTGLDEGQESHGRLGMTYSESTWLGSAFKTAQIDNFKAIFGTHANIWGVKPFRYEGFKPFCGEALVSTDGTKWERSRNILRPFFNLKNINDLTFFEGLVQKLLQDVPKGGESINMEPLIADMSLDNASRTVLGEPVGVYVATPDAQAPLDGKAFAEAWHKSLLACGMRMFFGRLSFLLPSSITYHQWAKVHNFFDYYVDRAMKARDMGNSFAGKHSVINAVLDLTSDKHEVRKQALHAMLASQDTTPVLLCNTFWILARRPDLWKRLREEVAIIPAGSMTIEEARKPQLLRNILSEVLRLWPVFPVLARDATADTVLPVGGGPDNTQPVFCPAGTNVIADFWTFNRDPKGVFGADAGEFRPERWNDLQLTAWDNMTFGNGLRTCLGRHKALGEASCLLIRFAQTFEKLESRDDRPYAGVLQLVARNKNGCHVAFRSKA